MSKKTILTRRVQTAVGDSWCVFSKSRCVTDSKPWGAIRRDVRHLGSPARHRLEKIPNDVSCKTAQAHQSGISLTLRARRTEAAVGGGATVHTGSGRPFVECIRTRTCSCSGPSVSSCSRNGFHASCECSAADGLRRTTDRKSVV